MRSAFFGAFGFRTDLSRWPVYSLTDATKMFAGAKCFDQNLCEWSQRIPSNATTTSMFLASGCDTKADPDPMDTTRGPFCHPCSNSTTASPTMSPVLPPGPPASSPMVISSLDELYDMVDLHLAGLLGDIRSLDTSRVTSFESVFDVERNPAAATFNAPLEWDTSNAVSFYRMFYGAALFNSDISSFRTTNATTLASMCK